MIGKGAPEDFIHNLEQLASTHHADMSLDHIRAYYFGQRFIVEMEVVLPPRMTVRESHDIAMILQHKVCSSLAFAVHILYFIYTPSLCLCSSHSRSAIVSGDAPTFSPYAEAHLRSCK
jgi:divalent metal cation (Fe/Co/Zn/Cd) transporter